MRLAAGRGWTLFAHVKSIIIGPRFHDQKSQTARIKQGTSLASTFQLGHRIMDLISSCGASMCVSFRCLMSCPSNAPRVSVLVLRTCKVPLGLAHPERLPDGFHPMPIDSTGPAAMQLHPRTGGACTQSPFSILPASRVTKRIVRIASPIASMDNSSINFRQMHA